MNIDLGTLTWLHTALSLIALATGIIVILGLLSSRPLPGWTAIYLLTAVATSVTGFVFPFEKFLPSHWVGVLSLVALFFAILARYVFRYAGAWRWIYVVTLVVSVYFDAFVGVVQAFMKVPAIHALAPTASEPPFAVAQLGVLALFVAATIVAGLRYRGHGGSDALAAT